MALLVMLPDLAVMLVVALLVTVCAVARPELSMVAADVFEEVQVTESVKSVVLPSWRWPVAVNCAVWAEDNELLVVVIVIVERFETVTVTVVEPVTPSNVVLIVAVPVATPVTRPVELTVAMLLSDVDQLEESVIVSLAPSSYVPVATICCVFPTPTVGVEGVTVTVVREGGMKKFLHPAASRTASTVASLK